MSLEVDSAEEIESAIKINEIKEILSQFGDAQNFTIEIICHKADNSDKLNQKIVYKLNGTTDDVDTWLKRLIKMKSLAIAFYKNKH